LQAIVATYLLRRFAGFPNSLTSEREVFLFLFMGGVLGSLTNSTLSVTTLVITGRIPFVNFLSNWCTWWLGDALGIFIFTPLVLVWLLRPSDSWRKRRLSITLPIIALFVMTTATVYYESKNETERLKLEFDHHALALKTALESSISGQLTALRSLESFHSATTTFDRKSFKNFVNHTLTNLSGIQALSWNPLIRNSERDGFERSVNGEGHRNFQITEQSTDKQMVRAGNRLEYVPVEFIEPYQENHKALGYDVYSDPFRRKAIDQARDTGEITTTAARINLVQDQQHQYGILTLLPVYRKGLPHTTLQERRQAISGYLVAVFRGNDFVMAALEDANQDKLSYRLIDESAPTDDQLIFSNGQQDLKPLVLQEKGLFGRNLSLADKFAISSGGRSWRLEVFPTQEYVVSHQTDNAWLILIAGLLLTSMSGAFAMVSSGRGTLLLRLVEERTAALVQSEERFRSTFEGAPIGVAIVTLTGDFLEANQSYCDFVGYSRDELLNMTFMQLTHPDYHESNAEIVRQTLLGDISGFNMEKRYVRKDGKVVWGNLWVNLIRQADNSPDHLVAVVENIEHRKQMEADMAKSFSLLSATLDSTNDAILAVDLHNTWVLHNQKFVDLWHISGDIIATKDDQAALTYILDQVCDPDTFLLRLRELYSSPELSSFETIKLKNGKIIQRHSIPQLIDGKVVGRVWSFRDITERVMAEQSLQRESEKNRALLRNASDGIHILDASGNVIEASDSFCAMLGYTRDKVIGMNVVQWDVQFTALECIQLLKQLLENPESSLFETRHRRKDGTIIDVEISALPLKLEGKTVLFNSSRDITARKETEASLRKLSLAVEQSPSSVVITNLDGNIEYVNEGFLKVTGYSRDEIIGQNPRILQSGKTDKATYESLWAALSHGTIWQGELINKKKNGEEYIESELISPLRRPDGTVSHYVCIKVDITEQKQAEIELKKNMDALERFNRAMVGRELQMIALKQEINDLCHRLGLPARYVIAAAKLLNESKTNGGDLS
jgi:PAS domain S-box-containing protein